MVILKLDSEEHLKDKGGATWGAKGAVASFFIYLFIFK